MPNLTPDQLCTSKACPYKRTPKIDKSQLVPVFTLESGTPVLRNCHPITLDKFCYYHRKAEDIPTFAPKKVPLPSPFDELKQFKSAQAKKYRWSHKDT